MRGARNIHLIDRPAENMSETCQNNLHLLTTLKKQHPPTPTLFLLRQLAVYLLAASKSFSPFQLKFFFIMAQDHMGNYKRTLRKEKETARKF